jgi:2-succinyl-5-enolpyruvyl-6-hydroxy-3-cyclohexene-1-carboxylate synthase
LLLLGDQAVLHDLPALAAAQSLSVNGCICVVNNQGSAIFDFLGASKMGGYLETIRTINDIDIEAAAACFRLPYHRCESISDIKGALQRSRVTNGLHVVEVKVPPNSVVDGTLFLYEALEQDSDWQTDWATMQVNA